MIPTGEPLTRNERRYTIRRLESDGIIEKGTAMAWTEMDDMPLILVNREVYAMYEHADKRVADMFAESQRPIFMVGDVGSPTFGFTPEKPWPTKRTVIGAGLLGAAVASVVTLLVTVAGMGGL